MRATGLRTTSCRIHELEIKVLDQTQWMITSKSKKLNRRGNLPPRVEISHLPLKLDIILTCYQDLNRLPGLNGRLTVLGLDKVTKLLLLQKLSVSGKHCLQ